MYKKVVIISGFLLILTCITGIIGIPQVRDQEKVAPKEQSMVCGIERKGPLPTVNPLDPMVKSGYTYAPMYEPLFIITVQGEYEPIIGKEWEWVDEYTLQVTLNPHAHFWDGDPVTTEDVVFSYETMGNVDYGGRLKSSLEMVDSFEIVDSKTFMIHLSTDLPAYYGKAPTLVSSPNTGPFIIEKERWSKLIDEYGKEILTFKNMDMNKINATGPYTLYESTAEAATYKRVNNYWGNEIGRFFAPKYYKAFWLASGEITLRGMEDGSFDTGHVLGVDFEYFKNRKIPDGLFWAWNPEGPPAEWKDYDPKDFVCILNPEKEIFRQRWFRHAAAYAMNYDKLVEVGGTAEIGYPSPPYFINTRLPWEEYYNSDIVKKYYETETTAGITHIKYSPEKAIEILDEHCEGSVEEGWTWKGEKLGPWDVLGWSGPSDVMSCVKVISKSFKDIGIEARPDLPTYAEWNKKCMNFTFDIRWGLNWMPLTPKPIANAYESTFLTPGTTWTNSKCNYFKYWTENYPSTEDTADEVRNLVDELWATPEGTKKSFELARKVQEIVIPQLPIIPLYQTASALEFTVADWVNYPYKDDPLEWLTKGVETFACCLRHVYPKRVITKSFSLSKSVARPGETVTAEVTLKNEGEEEQMYPVYLHNGPADPGLSKNNRIAWKAPIVPAGETKTVRLEFAIEEPGDYTITVDDWRYSKWDPGEPIEKAFTVKTAAPPVGPPISPVLEELRKDVSSLKESLHDIGERLSEIQKTTEQTKGAATTTMVIVSMIVTIVVVLVGTYVITRRQTPH